MFVFILQNLFLLSGNNSQFPQIKISRFEIRPIIKINLSNKSNKSQKLFTKSQILWNSIRIESYKPLYGFSYPV